MLLLHRKKPISSTVLLISMFNPLLLLKPNKRLVIIDLRTDWFFVEETTLSEMDNDNELCRWLKNQCEILRNNNEFVC